MSSNPTTVTIYYPFHPLVNHTLEVITWPRKPAHAVTLKHPDGNAVKIPLWMLQPDAAHFHLSEQIELSASALSALVDLLTLHASSKVEVHSHPKQTHAATQVHTRERRGNSSQLTNADRARTKAHRTDGASHPCTPSTATRRRR
jgi:hypothetical protein